MGQSFKDLLVWQRAIELTTETYKLTAAFPKEERFGLTNQMRRAAVSIASNIAEGFGRATRGEYIQFLGHARGSCSELETQLVIAGNLRFGSSPNLETSEALRHNVSRLLSGLMKSLRTKQPAK
ncbi:MAG: four helix bundle protein [Terracidiphilus sp.]|jgi:four helix bundle protein